MREYILSTESTSDLSKKHYEDRKLSVIPFSYYINGVEHKDDFGQSLPLAKFYKLMEEGALTKTSQINVNDYFDYFEKIVRSGKDILHLTLSSGISGTYNSAIIAKKMIEEKYKDAKVLIVDSLAASSGFGLLSDLLADKRDEGLSIDELYDYALKHRLEVNHWFFSTDLKYYVRGGRISKTSGFVGTLLKICPLLNVDFKGRLIPREKIRTKKRVIMEIVKKMRECVVSPDYDGKCYISHSACLEDANEVKNLVEMHFPKLKGKVEIYDIGTTIGAHTGPGTVALFFLGKARPEE